VWNGPFQKDGRGGEEEADLVYRVFVFNQNIIQSVKVNTIKLKKRRSRSGRVIAAEGEVAAFDTSASMASSGERSRKESGRKLVKENKTKSFFINRMRKDIGGIINVT
jgi:hypothetical protein